MMAASVEGLPVAGEVPAMLLDPVLDLAAARPLAEHLLAARGSDLVVDASQVRHLGAQCGQILVSAIKTWRTDGHALRIAAETSEFTEAVRLLGLRPLLQVEG